MLGPVAQFAALGLVGWPDDRAGASHTVRIVRVCERSGERLGSARSVDDRVRLEISPRREHERPLPRSRVREGQHGVGEAHLSG